MRKRIKDIQVGDVIRLRDNNYDRSYYQTIESISQIQDGQKYFSDDFLVPLYPELQLDVGIPGSLFAVLVFETKEIYEEALNANNDDKFIVALFVSAYDAKIFAENKSEWNWHVIVRRQ